MAIKITVDQKNGTNYGIDLFDKVDINNMVDKPWENPTGILAWFSQHVSDEIYPCLVEKGYAIRDINEFILSASISFMETFQNCVDYYYESIDTILRI